MENAFYQANFRDDDVVEFSAGIEPEMCKFGKFKQALQSALEGKLPDTLVEYLESKAIKGTSINELIEKRWQNNNRKWFSAGKACQILSVDGKGWQKGKLRIKFTLEFCPDEPEIEEITQSNDLEINQAESPLDDIRRMMNKDN